MKELTREEQYRRLNSVEELEALYRRVKASPYRQLFHIQPVTGLLNDPNGFVRHNGKWHLFYQWCPWGAVHGLKYWYHVTSTDLVHWQNEGVCIRPDLDIDNFGAYSGSALPGRDALCLVYTGNHRDEDWTRVPNTCLVKLYDDGRTAKLPWPLFGPNPDYTEHQRDPKILFNEKRNKYYIVLGAQNQAHRGCILVYQSDNLIDGWEFAGELKVPGFEDFGSMWECPSIENISGRDVLLFCPQHIHLPRRGGAVCHSGYIIGHMDWDELTFTPDGSFHVLDFGFDTYAAECAANTMDKDCAILTAWMGLPDASCPTDEEGWQGCLTLPRELRVRGRRLIQRPIPALTSLRSRELDVSAGVLHTPCELEILIGEEDSDDEARGDFDLELFCGKAGEGGLWIHYNAHYRLITVDRSRMKIRFGEEPDDVREHLIDNPLTDMRIFIDKSSVEIFINDGDAVFTSRIFPEESERYFRIGHNANARLWSLKETVKDELII